MCPVAAWKLYKLSTYLNPNGPAFVLPGGSPLCAPLVVNLMRDALSGDPAINVTQISMHSIRRGAAQEAEKQGSSISDIMLRGAWASRSGLNPYLAK